MWCYNWPPEFSGAGLQARRLGQALAARGWRVWAISTSTRHARLTEEDDGGIRVVWLPRPRLRRLSLLALATFWQYWRALRRRRSQFDILHIHSAYFDAALAATLARMWRKPCLVKNTLPGVDMEVYGRGLWGKWQRWAFQTVGAFAGASPAAVDEMLRHGLPASKINRIPNGVDTNVFQPVSAEERRSLRERLGLPPDARILINHSSITARKGSDVLIEAMGQIAERHPDVHLALVGPWERDGRPMEGDSPDWLPRLRARIEELGLRDRVHLPGSQSNTHEWLGASEVFVFPTLNDLLPNSLLEAMAVGLPIVAFDVACSQALLSDGQTGLVTPVGDVAAFAQAVERHLENPEAAHRMGLAASRHIAEAYSLRSVVRAYEELYTSLLAP